MNLPLPWLRPSKLEIDAVAAEFNLHGLAVEDTIKAHQRPKRERYGDVDFIVLRPARYVDPVEVVRSARCTCSSDPTP